MAEIFLAFLVFLGALAFFILGGGPRIEAHLRKRADARAVAEAANVTPIGVSPLDASMNRHPSGQG